MNLYEKILKKYNITTLLILPLLNNLAKTIKINNLQHNIFSLIFERGFVNSYLFYEDNLSSNFSIKLIFKNKEFTKPIPNNNYYTNLLDIFIHNKLLKNFKVYKKYTMIEIPINPIFKDDIVKIMSSDYSNVSEAYKKAISMKGYNVPVDSPENYFMLVHNLPLSVVNKSNKLVQYINEIYKTNLEKDEIKELLPIFNKEKETLNETDYN